MTQSAIENSTGPKCIFCHEERTLTKEHPLSKRVLDLAGFELSDTYLCVDRPLAEVSAELVEQKMRTVAEEFKVCSCARCNNGWMQNLDHSFAGTVERWVEHPTHRLGPLGLQVIRRYLLKVLWVDLGEEYCRPDVFSDGKFNPYFIQSPKDADLVRLGTLDAIADQVSVGVARVSAQSVFTTALFAPRLPVRNANDGCHRFNVGMVLALPKLGVQFWVVRRTAGLGQVSWPRHVEELTHRTRFSRVGHASDLPDVDNVKIRTSSATKR